MFFCCAIRGLVNGIRTKQADLDSISRKVDRTQSKNYKHGCSNEGASNSVDLRDLPFQPESSGNELKGRSEALWDSQSLFHEHLPNVNEASLFFY